MADEQHRGSVNPGPFTQTTDPRTTALDTALRAVETVVRAIAPGLGPVSDTGRAAVNQQQRMHDHGQFFVGTIVHPIGHLGWYKVQTGNVVGTIFACQLSQTGFTPMGVRDTSVLPPNTEVFGYIPNSFNHGYIIGAIPTDLTDGTLVNPDWIVQGGQSGYKREKLHKFPVQNHYNCGHIRDFSGQRPVDSTAFEWGKMGITGVGITIDDFMAQLRVNEACGLFMTWFDSWCKLTGVQLDIQSAVHEERARDDEGEARYVRGLATYPWEALGLYFHGPDITTQFSDQEVQYTKARAKLDQAEGEEDLQPVYRYTEWGGYEGQGHHRVVCKPAKDSGKRFFKDRDPVDEGLFAETIGIDGAYSLRAAKSVYIGRRTKIIIPKEIKLPEDKKGDDSEENNYKFSSEFGGGENHKLKEIKVTGEWKHMRRVSAVEDLIAFQVNWKSLHPFWYHRKDYETKQESEKSDHFQRVQEVIDFGELDNQPFVRDPTPITLRIDHRYTDAEYYQRESFLYLTDDGGVILAAGQGEAVVLGGGTVRIEAPGDVQVAPGRVLTLWAEQVSIRAKRSVDVSATEHDVSIKAERNLRFVGGVGGKGGILIESRSPGRRQGYKDKIGEDIDARGIVLKAANGLLGLYGKEIYLRTGGPELGDGEIIIDASKGRKKVNFKAKEFNFFCPKTVNFYYGPVEDSSTVNKVYAFARNFCLMDVKLFLGGKMIGYNGGGGRPGVIVDGAVLGTRAFATAGRMADRKGMFIGKVPGGFGSIISSACNSVAEISDLLKQAGEKKHEFGLVQRYYQTDQPGDNETIKNMQFSFRDPPSEEQYKVQQFRWVESRWQQMVRFGLGSGGVAWDERKVTYQGKELYPYPGKKKLKEEQVFLQLEELTMFDAGAGYSKDRPGPFEEPELSSWTPTTMNSGYKLIR